MKTILIAGLAIVGPVLAQAPNDVISQFADTVRLYFNTGSVVKNAPYSADAVTATTQVLGDGNRIEQRTEQKLYRDSDGRERREESVLAVGALAQAEMPHMITISDPVENVSYTLNPQQRTAKRSSGLGLVMNWLEPSGVSSNITLAIPPRIARLEVRPRLSIPQGGAGTAAGQIPVGAKVAKEDLGSRNIEGVLAQGTRTTETIPAGQIGNLLPINVVDEVWHSAELQMDVLTTHSDPRSGEVVYKLTNINRANPSRTLFEPPADYTITGPAAGGGGARGGGGRGAAPGVQK